jgi:hypothetical protein
MRAIAPAPTSATAIDWIGVANLPLPERVLLWAIRAWSAYHCDLTAIWSHLDRAFNDQGMGGALAPFDRMMSALFGGLKRWPDVRCVRCPHLGADEACLLRTLAYLQREETAAARRALHGWVIRPAVRTVCIHGAELADLASAAGWRFATASYVASPVIASPAARGLVPISVDAGLR